MHLRAEYHPVFTAIESELEQSTSRSHGFSLMSEISFSDKVVLDVDLQFLQLEGRSVSQVIQSPSGVSRNMIWRQWTARQS